MEIGSLGKISLGVSSRLNRVQTLSREHSVLCVDSLGTAPRIMKKMDLSRKEFYVPLIHPIRGLLCTLALKQPMHLLLGNKTLIFYNLDLLSCHLTMEMLV